jgi:hypothetical protein
MRSCIFQVDHEAHGSTTGDQYCVTLRRYAGMALTNLTFGDGANKALLCSFRQFMKALVAQLKSPSEDLRQVSENYSETEKSIFVDYIRNLVILFRHFMWSALCCNGPVP